MPKTTKPKINRPDLEDDAPAKPEPKMSIAPAPAEEPTAEELGEQRAIEGQSKLPIIAATGKPITETEEQAPLVDDVTGDFLKQIMPRLRVPESATISEIFQAIIDGKWSRKVLILTPFNRPINPHAHLAIVAHVRRNAWCGYEYETDTVIQRARNVLADKFLKSEAEWAMWMDQDTISPFAQPGWFVEKLGFDPSRVQPPEFTTQGAMLSTIPRLLSHNKKIVGGVYKQRRPKGRYVIQPHLHPRHAEDTQFVRELETKGPMDRLYEVGYVATGCALVHRSVYDDIKAAHPELAPKTEGDIWNFYGTDTNQSGEDIAFCKLADKAGHKSWLDCAVFCAHVGDWSYNP